MKVDIYADVVCPWSYQGKQQFDAALAQFDGRDEVEVEWKPFLLDAGAGASSFAAHRLLWWAREQGGAAAQSALAERLFAAQHAGASDIAAHATLAALAADAGLIGAGEFLATDDGTAEVKEAVGEARATGIESTPTFVFDERWAVSGAQPSEIMLELLEQVAAATIGALAGGGCCGGGCCGS